MTAYNYHLLLRRPKSRVMKNILGERRSIMQQAWHRRRRWRDCCASSFPPRRRFAEQSCDDVRGNQNILVPYCLSGAKTIRDVHDLKSRRLLVHIPHGDGTTCPWRGRPFAWGFCVVGKVRPYFIYKRAWRSGGRWVMDSVKKNCGMLIPTVKLASLRSLT